MTPAPIRIAIALLIRGDRQALLVRKRGSAFFMQPAGKIDACDAPCEALPEGELGINIDSAALASVGHIAAAAASETGATVDAELFRLDWAVGELAAKAEMAWVDPADTGGRVLAPLTRDDVLAFGRLGGAP